MKKVLSFIIFLFLFQNIVFADTEVVKFKKCVDGDTAVFVLDNKDIRVRFLAIDTPETVHPNKKVDPIGLLASDYTCDKITSAKEKILEYDVNSDKTDKYNRHLAWVWVDGSLLQEELIEKGYAKVYYLYGDYKYTNKLYDKEDIAKENKLGIWNEDSVYYFVTFIIDDKEEIKSVLENSRIDDFTPVKYGYEFIGWKKGKKDFDINTRITSDIKLTAEFKKTITFLDILLVILLLGLLYLTNRKSFNKIVKRELKKLKI